MNSNLRYTLDKNERENNNYIFYVSEKDILPELGHFRKMDAGMEIANHICKGNPAKILCYTEYDGSLMDAESVGIVFPTHSWGISLAVCSFLQHLRITKGTYVYAVAIGESFVGNTSSLDSFVRLFEKKAYGSKSNIFVRSRYQKRSIISTEDKLKKHQVVSKKIEAILNGLLFHDLKTLCETWKQSSKNVHEQTEDFRKNYAFDENNDKKSKEILQARSKANRRIMHNIFLDDSLLSEVRLCQVM